MAHSHPLPPKKEVALALLERSSVHVHLDPRAKNVFVPQMFKERAQLVLQVGLNLPVLIPDLRLDDQGMACTLSFNRAPFYCVVPWSSVFAMVGDDGRGMVWPDDVPPEIAAQAQPRPQPQLASAPEPVKRPVGVPNPKRVLAEVPPPGGKPKKKSRKKTRAGSDAESDRPVLVAVPAPEKRAKPEPAAAHAKPAAEKAERMLDKTEKTDHEPKAKPEKPRRPQGGPPRVKRELPPYLRVVK
jgi:hypothetical protein